MATVQEKKKNKISPPMKKAGRQNVVPPPRRRLFPPRTRTSAFSGTIPSFRPNVAVLAITARHMRQNIAKLTKQGRFQTL